MKKDLEDVTTQKSELLEGSDSSRDGSSQPHSAPSKLKSGDTTPELTPGTKYL